MPGETEQVELLAQRIWSGWLTLGDTMRIAEKFGYPTDRSSGWLTRSSRRIIPELLINTLSAGCSTTTFLANARMAAGSSTSSGPYQNRTRRPGKACTGLSQTDARRG